MANVRFEIGPCDDDAFLYLDGNKIVSLKLGETRAFNRDLGEGAHSLRFTVVNSGAWAWRATISVRVGAQTLAEVDQAGNTGFAGPTVFNQLWDFEIKNGALVG